MYKSTALAAVALASVAGIAAAAEYTTDLWLIGFDSQPMVASVVGSDEAKATTYAIGCRGGEEDEDCNVPQGFTFTQGPSTLHYRQTMGQAKYELGCKVTSSASAVCSMTVDSMVSGSSQTSIDTTSIGTSDLRNIKVTVTAGGKAGGAGTAPLTTTSNGPTATTSGDKVEETGAAQTTGGAAPSGSGAAPSNASQSSVSTGGMPAVTANAQWVVGGAAAVIALAAL